MDARDIEKLVAKAKDDIIKEVHDRLPRKVGVVAVNHFKQNFRDGGWLDNGLHPWNCKCSLEATDEPVVRPADLEPTQPQRGLENNPGKDGHTFSDKHPYFPRDCSRCFAYKKGSFSNRLKALFLNREKDCYNCPFINSCIEPSPISKYDKKKWEHTYVAPDGKGFVVTEKERIEEGRASKNEAAKFQKELHMCKVAADNGHEIQFLKGTGRKVG